jgi:hypothetical protein
MRVIFFFLMSLPILAHANERKNDVLKKEMLASYQRFIRKTSIEAAYLVQKAEIKVSEFSFKTNLEQRTLFFDVFFSFGRKTKDKRAKAIFIRQSADWGRGIISRVIAECLFEKDQIASLGYESFLTLIEAVKNGTETKIKAVLLNDFDRHVVSHQKIEDFGIRLQEAYELGLYVIVLSAKEPLPENKLRKYFSVVSDFELKKSSCNSTLILEPQDDFDRH